MKRLERISQHSFLPALVRADSTVLDLGGNRGEFSLGVMNRYGWHAVAIEPTPSLAQHLQSAGVEVIEAVAASEDGSVEFIYYDGKELTGSIMGLDVVGSELSDAAGLRKSRSQHICYPGY